MTYTYIKALHIIFVVTWFAGLFYIVRLFIYQTEAYEKPEPERSILIKQFKHMSRLLWNGITWPSAIITLGMGTYFIVYYYGNLPGWLGLKLGFVAGLYLYHFLCHVIYRNLQKDQVKLTSQKLRVWNEIATLFLFSIVFLAVLKNTLGLLWGIAGLIILTAVLMVAIKIYKNIRNKKTD